MDIGRFRVAVTLPNHIPFLQFRSLYPVLVICGESRRPWRRRQPPFVSHDLLTPGVMVCRVFRNSVLRHLETDLNHCYILVCLFLEGPVMMPVGWVYVWVQVQRSLILEIEWEIEKSKLPERLKILQRLRLQWVSPHYFPQFHCGSIYQVSSYVLRPVHTF
jgi:hypothetical protein